LAPPAWGGWLRPCLSDYPQPLDTIISEQFGPSFLYKLNATPPFTIAPPSSPFLSQITLYNLSLLSLFLCDLRKKKLYGRVLKILHLSLVLFGWFS
jgi:hypothetical protein